MRIAEFSESSSFRTQIALSGYPGSTLLRALQTNRRRLSMREVKTTQEESSRTLLTLGCPMGSHPDRIFPFFFSLGDVAILPWPPCIGVMGNSLCSSGILTPNPNELLPHYYTFNEHIRNCVFFSSCFFFSDLSPFLSSFSIPVRERFQFARELHNVLKIIHASLT